MKNAFLKAAVVSGVMIWLIKPVSAESLSGKISDQQSKIAVPGAVVWLENTAYADTTDAEGNYSITGVPQGIYTIIIAAPFHKQRVFRNFMLDGTVAIDKNETSSRPADFELLGNYPNPFNPTTTIAYLLPEAEHVSLIIYDMQGRFVAKLLDVWQTPENHAATWDGKDHHGLAVPSGVYFYQVRAGKFMKTSKMVLVK